MANVSGSCALHRDSYDVSPISVDRLVKALGDGSFKVEGDVTGNSQEIPVNGTCTYYRDDEPDVRRLAVSINVEGDAFGPYESARKTMETDADAVKIAGEDGHVISSVVTDNDDSVVEAAQAVLFDGDRVVIARILVPGRDVKASAAAPDLARAAVAAPGIR